MVRFIFRCEFCEAQPDPLTQLSLLRAMHESTWGAYQEAQPGGWLVFHGRGLYGPPRYACAEHRGDLVAFLRNHYGAVGFHVWKRPPYPSSLAHSDTDHAWMVATRRQHGWGSLASRRPRGYGGPVTIDRRRLLMSDWSQSCAARST